MPPDGAPDALFHRDGAHRFVPTALTTGPWRADAMHGGPPGALVATAAARVVPEGFHLARLNVELERPVPLRPLTTSAVPRTVSRRVVHVDVLLALDDGAVVVRARALALARFDIPPPQVAVVDAERSDLGSSVPVRMGAFASGDLQLTYHRDAVEHRMLPGGAFVDPGPAVAWARLRQPLIAGEPTVPLARVMAVADFGSGISAVYGTDEGVGLINADLSVAVGREPVGEWIRLDSCTHLHREGSAVAITTLHDADGHLGVATQSLLGLRF